MDQFETGLRFPELPSDFDYLMREQFQKMLHYQKMTQASASRRAQLVPQVILEGRCAKGNPRIQDESHRLKLTDGWARVEVRRRGSGSGGERRGAEVSRNEQRGEQRGSSITDFEGEGAENLL